MIEGIYNITIQIYRKSNTGTTFKPVWTWLSVYEGKGLLNQLSGSEVVRDEGNTVVADHLLYCDVMEITNKDRIVYSGNYYEIYSIHNPNNMNDHLEIKCKLLAEGI